MCVELNKQFALELTDSKTQISGYKFECEKQ